MSYISIEEMEKVAVVRLQRGKVNALNEEVVEGLIDVFDELQGRDETQAVVLTGSGRFFSFGFDIPEFMAYSRQEFKGYLSRFTELYRQLFLFPKPVLAAINGHCIAGGCMLTNACDYRVMVSSNAKISLNEVTFGAAVFAGSVAILKHLVGSRKAEEIVLTGKMYTAEEAAEAGLIDDVSDVGDVLPRAVEQAEAWAQLDRAAFAQVKALLRQPVVDAYLPREKESIDRFVELWYAPEMRKRLEKITIRK